MSDPVRDLTAWFTRSGHGIDPKRAIWLTEENIRNLAKDEKFMASFYARRATP